MNPENLVENPGRRAKGTPNRIPAGVKRQFLEAFQLIGGARGLYRWASAKRRYKLKHADGSYEWVIAEPNRKAFYELLSILIPAQTLTRVAGEVTHNHAYVALPQPIASPGELINNNENNSDDIL